MFHLKYLHEEGEVSDEIESARLLRNRKSNPKKPQKIKNSTVTVNCEICREKVNKKCLSYHKKTRHPEILIKKNKSLTGEAKKRHLQLLRKMYVPGRVANKKMSGPDSDDDERDSDDKEQESDDTKHKSEKSDEEKLESDDDREKSDEEKQESDDDRKKSDKEKQKSVVTKTQSGKKKNELSRLVQNTALSSEYEGDSVARLKDRSSLTASSASWNSSEYQPFVYLFDSVNRKSEIKRKDGQRLRSGKKRKQNILNRNEEFIPESLASKTLVVVPDHNSREKEIADEDDVFGRLVSSELRTMTDVRAKVALKSVIMNAVYRAKIGLLSNAASSLKRS